MVHLPDISLGLLMGVQSRRTAGLQLVFVLVMVAYFFLQ